MKSSHYTVREVEVLLSVSYSKACKVVAGLNRELKEKGFYIIQGRVSRIYFDERLLGTKKAPATTDAKEKITSK